MHLIKTISFSLLWHSLRYQMLLSKEHIAFRLCTIFCTTKWRRLCVFTFTEFDMYKADFRLTTFKVSDPEWWRYYCDTELRHVEPGSMLERKSYWPHTRVFEYYVIPRDHRKRCLLIITSQQTIMVRAKGVLARTQLKLFNLTIQRARCAYVDIIVRKVATEENSSEIVCQ